MGSCPILQHSLTVGTPVDTPDRGAAQCLDLRRECSYPGRQQTASDSPRRLAIIIMRSYSRAIAGRHWLALGPDGVRVERWVEMARNDSQSGARRSPKISEVIARELASQIVNQKLPAGSVLPTEKEMIESFDVGRSTIREALRLLETRSVITLRPGPGGGPVVRRPRPEDLGEALTLILQFEDASLDDVMEARRAIEPMIARLAAARISDAELDTMEATIGVILDDPRPEVFQEQNRIFHSTLSKAARSVVLQVFVESLSSVADGVAGGVTYTARRYVAAAHAHTRIIEALRAHDGDLAEKMMRDHLDEADAYWHKKHKNLVSRPVVWRR
ncbi:hypothetical protein GCM10017691_36930 [Pseudonocardia petroleophila]